MKRFGILSTLAVVTLGTVTTVAPATGRAEPAANDPAVITAWIEIAARTIYPENATPLPASALYFGFMSLAVYDAVVAIEGGFEPINEQPGADAGAASSQVAAATAAYQVLLYFFPASGELLAADYAAALDAVPDGASKEEGIRVGEAAAAALIASRDGDGRGAPRLQPGGTDLGQWRPTPPDAFMIVPWLGFVSPLLLQSPTQFALPGPNPVTSEAYAADFLEVMQMGAKEGSQRTPEQTATAMFWTTNSIRKYQLALADRLANEDLDIAETARVFAILNASTADAEIACWRAKYDFDYWRPVTAIRLADTDGNDATEPNPQWEPLVNSPPYSDYTSGHACITGAATETVNHLFGADNIDLTVPSLSDAPPRHFDTAAAIDEETNNARIWLGIHFRKAMTDGNQLGHDVAAYAIATYFQPAE